MRKMKQNSFLKQKLINTKTLRFKCIIFLKNRAKSGGAYNDLKISLNLVKWWEELNNMYAWIMSCHSKRHKNIKTQGNGKTSCTRGRANTITSKVVISPAAKVGKLVIKVLEHLSEKRYIIIGYQAQIYYPERCFKYMWERHSELSYNFFFF